MRGFVIGLGSVWLGLFFSATAGEIAYGLAEEPGDRPWYLVLLWAGCAVTLVLLLIAAAIWLVTSLRRYVNAVTIQDDIRCAVWTLEKQVKVTAWFHDRGGAKGYKATCRVHFGGHCIHSSEPEIGGTYAGRRSLQNADPFMIEFLWRDVEIVDPAEARVLIEIIPEGWAGARKQKSKTVQSTVIDRRDAPNPPSAADARACQIGTLTVFMSEGFNLKDEIRELVNKWDEKYADRARGWEQRALVYLDRELPAYSGTFRLDNVIQQWQPGACFEVATWGNFMDRRLAAIDRIVTELRSLAG